VVLLLLGAGGPEVEDGWEWEWAPGGGPDGGGGW